MKRKILLTGASGFIGSAVARKLLNRKNIELHCVVGPHSKPWRLKDIGESASIYKIDLSSSKSVNILFKKINPEAVLHLATHGVYSYQQENTERVVVDNYLMVVNLLEASKKYGVKQFVNTGSVFEYGSQEGPMKEGDVDISDILNKYSAVKMATTAFANSYTNDFKVITLRPFTAYGPFGDKSRFVMANILRALKNESIRIVGGVIRDFVYVEDVADGFVRALYSRYDSGDIINLGSGKEYSLKEVVELVKKLARSKSDIVVDKKYKRNKESRCWADVKRAQKVLNWAPKHSLREGLEETILWVKEYY